jgi:hypothetical protein
LLAFRRRRTDIVLQHKRPFVETLGAINGHQP